MFIAHVLREVFGERKNLNCLDLCAAPGGKSLNILNFLDGNGLLVSNELIKSRNSILRENLIKRGAENVVATCNSAEDFNSLKNFFDLVLVDAPCSGEGLFRKDKSAIEEWSEDNVKMCAIRQKSILQSVSDSLKQDGILIYCTCTFSPDENENVVSELMQSGLFESVKINIPETWGIEKVLQNDFEAYRFLPHKIPGEGLFVALLRKLGGASTKRISSNRHWFQKQKNASQSTLSKWINESTENVVLDGKENVWLSSASPETLNFLSEKLYISMPGVHAGQFIRDEFIPDHGLAMSKRVSLAVNQITLGESEALKFLRLENLSPQETKPGWTLVRFDSHNLGWLKVMPNRMNNYYPKEWKIRMK